MKNKKYKCPVCGSLSFEKENDFGDCEVCLWENDGVQEHYPDEEGGANRMSLNQAKEAYKQGKSII